MTKRKKVVVPRSVSPEKLAVINSWLKDPGIEVMIVNFDNETGEVDLDAVTRSAKDAAAVCLELPNFFGVLERSVADATNIAHSAGALFIAGVDITSLGVLKAPADYGADIVVAEGQPLGLYPNFGGPLLGTLACRGEIALVRQMSGRIVDMTTTREGERAFTMILQTRE